MDFEVAWVKVLLWPGPTVTWVNNSLSLDLGFFIWETERSYLRVTLRFKINKCLRHLIILLIISYQRKYIVMIILWQKLFLCHIKKKKKKCAEVYLSPVFTIVGKGNWKSGTKRSEYITKLFMVRVLCY